jgi:hypothetical protein
LTVLLLFLVILFVHAVLLEESFPPHGTFTIGYLFFPFVARGLLQFRGYINVKSNF